MERRSLRGQLEFDQGDGVLRDWAADRPPPAADWAGWLADVLPPLAEDAVRPLADHLARIGVAVLRTDDRGVGGSQGNLRESTTADLADDALAGVAFLLVLWRFIKGPSPIDRIIAFDGLTLPRRVRVDTHDGRNPWQTPAALAPGNRTDFIVRIPPDAVPRSDAS